MEIENPTTITFDKLLSHYTSLNQANIEQIAKGIDKKITIEVLPPFVTVHVDSKDELEIGFDQLLLIWERYINKAFPGDVIKLEGNNIFYITRYDDGIMIAKNQDDDALFFIGKFAPGEVVLFSYASQNVEKITRLKLLMTLYNGIVQKTKPEKTEKKK